MSLRPKRAVQTGVITFSLWGNNPRYTVGAVRNAELARHVLRLGFAERDRARMHELAVKNQEGEISPAERQELDNFVKVGDLLAVLQSKARLSLKRLGLDGR